MIDFDALSHEIIGYRRDLHQIPELGFYVYKTSAYIRSILDKLSCQVEEIVKTGHQDGYLRRTRRRSCIDRILPQNGTELRFLLAVPCSDCQTCGSQSGDQQ